MDGDILVKFIFWILFVPFIFHLVAGIRHLLSDIHIGDTLKAGRLMAIINVYHFHFISDIGRYLVMVKTVLGTAHEGLRDWVIQRISAIFMAVYSLGLIIYLMLSFRFFFC